MGFWTKAFGVRIGKSAKTFIVIRDGGRRIKLGRYPDLSLQDARAKARRILLDPYAAPAEVTTLGEAIDKYLDAWVRPNYRQRSAYNTERLLTHVQSLRKRPLIELKSTELSATIDALPPSQANHVFGALRTFFNWAERQDLGPSPMRKLWKPHRDRDRDRTLYDDELRAVWNACADDNFGSIVKLLILTGQRRGEIAAIEPAWTDREVLTVTLPARATKNGLEHTFPLARGARTLMRRALDARDPTPERFRSHLLFPSLKTGDIVTGWAKQKAALDRRSGITAWTLHDLRRTFSTKLADLGVQPHIVDRCLNHQTGSISPIARRYNRHKYREEMRAAFDLYDTYIFGLIAP